MKINFFKKYILKLNIICLILMCVFMCGCSLQPKKDTSRLSVVVVNFPQYDFAKAVCGDKADVTMIIRPGSEVHGYEPSLSDIVAIQNADVFIYGGGRSDVWVDRVLASADNDKMTKISFANIPNLTLHKEESHANGILEHGHSHSHDQHNSNSFAGVDEHVWTSPKNAIKIVEHIGYVMGKVDSQNKDYYQQNVQNYVKDLKAIDKELEATVANAKTNFIAVADRFPFVYMAKDYGLYYIAAFSGCSPESDAGPSVVAHMIEEMSYHDVNRVFHIELSNQKMADAICEHTGAKKLLLHSCQNVTEADFKKGITYADLMKQNIINLKEALN